MIYIEQSLGFTYGNFHDEVFVFKAFFSSVLRQTVYHRLSRRCRVTASQLSYGVIPPSSAAVRVQAERQSAVLLTPLHLGETPSTAPDTRHRLREMSFNATFCEMRIFAHLREHIRPNRSQRSSSTCYAAPCRQVARSFQMMHRHGNMRSLLCLT